ncbi:MAG: hypothetical protein SEPTF4163_001741 [Sporothrix epigloea]
MAAMYADPSYSRGTDHLSRLPVELVLRITRHLKSTDLCAVRLCSRALECALRHFFLHEFFRRKQFMLTDFSLQSLLAIAQTPGVSQTLRHVSIGLEEYSTENLNESTAPKHAINFLTAAAQQKALLSNGRAVQLLAAAFSLLTNLETVQLRDFDSPTRFRDGPSETWSSYGMRRALEQLGSQSRRLLGKSINPDFSSRAFALIVSALALSDACPPNIEVLSRSTMTGLKSFAFDLSPVPYMSLHGESPKNGVGVYPLAVLAGLRRLHLSLKFYFHSLRYNHNHEGNPPFTDSFRRSYVDLEPLHAWLAHCPNIDWLRINLMGDGFVHNDLFLHKLGSPLPAYYPLPPGSTASRDITMPFAAHLTRFDLGNASCTRDVLLELLHRMPALERLSLWKVSLMAQNFKEETPLNLWKNLFGALAKDPFGSRLKRVSLTKLGIVTYTRDLPGLHTTHVVTFDGLNDVHHTVAVDESMASWLQALPIRIKREGWALYDSDSEDLGPFYVNSNSNYVGGNGYEEEANDEDEEDDEDSEDAEDAEDSGHVEHA